MDHADLVQRIVPLRWPVLRKYPALQNTMVRTCKMWQPAAFPVCGRCAERSNRRDTFCGAARLSLRICRLALVAESAAPRLRRSDFAPLTASEFRLDTGGAVKVIEPLQPASTFNSDSDRLSPIARRESCSARPDAAIKTRRLRTWLRDFVVRGSRCFPSALNLPSRRDVIYAGSITANECGPESTTRPASGFRGPTIRAAV